MKHCKLANRTTLIDTVHKITGATVVFYSFIIISACIDVRLECQVRLCNLESVGLNWSPSRAALSLSLSFIHSVSLDYVIKLASSSSALKVWDRLGEGRHRWEEEALSQHRRKTKQKKFSWDNRQVRECTKHDQQRSLSQIAINPECEPVCLHSACHWSGNNQCCHCLYYSLVGRSGKMTSRRSFT